MLQLELYGKLDKEASKIAVNARSIVLVVAKADTGFWPRLLQQKGKTANNIKVDWNKVRASLGPTATALRACIRDTHCTLLCMRNAAGCIIAQCRVSLAQRSL